MRPYSTFFIAGLMALSPMVAMAADGDTQCTKGSDVRHLEILTPGTVGAACDLKYTRDAGRNVAIPYHANNNAGFCATKADEIVGNLVADGFKCTALAVAAGEPVAEVVSQSETVAALDQSATQASAPQPTIEEIIQSTEEQAAAVEQPAPVIAKAPIESVPVVEKTENLTASLPASTTASGPIDLTAKAKPVAQRAPRPTASSVGRVVGSAPDPDRVARIEAAEARADGIQNAAVNPQEAVAPTPVSQPTQVDAQQDVKPAVVEKTASENTAPEANDNKPKSPTRVRPAPTIIKSVLNAQAAAWNEGDLEAFMAGYWNNRDLRFVSDDQVTRGWSQTLKRYQKKYAGESMGVLAFERLDVQMLTDDVAIIVGRFNLDRKSQIDTGTFSLVMRQFDGRWRIVHDHTVSDSKITTAAN